MPGRAWLDAPHVGKPEDILCIIHSYVIDVVLFWPFSPKTKLHMKNVMKKPHEKTTGQKITYTPQPFIL